MVLLLGVNTEIILTSILKKSEPEYATDDEADITLRVPLLRCLMELLKVVIPTGMMNLMIHWRSLKRLKLYNIK